MTNTLDIRTPDDYVATPEYVALVQRYGVAELYFDYADDSVTVYGPEDDETVVLPRR